MRDPRDVIASTLHYHGVPRAWIVAGAILSDLDNECFAVVDPLEIGTAIVAAAQCDSEER